MSVTPLSAPAVEMLRKRLGEEYVFPVRGNPVNQTALSVALFASRKAGGRLRARRYLALFTWSESTLAGADER